MNSLIKAMLFWYCIVLAALIGAVLTFMVLDLTGYAH